MDQHKKYKFSILFMLIFLLVLIIEVFEGIYFKVLQKEKLKLTLLLHQYQYY